MEGFDGALDDVLATVNHLDAPLAASVAWTGVISTSFTIWLCTEAFKHLPSVDASLILTSEPLWAALVAAALLGERFSAGDALRIAHRARRGGERQTDRQAGPRMCLVPHCVVEGRKMTIEFPIPFRAGARVGRGFAYPVMCVFTEVCQRASPSAA